MVSSKITELNDILTLSSFFSGAVSPILVDIVEKVLAQTSDAEEDQHTRQSSACAIGICMQKLAKRDVSEWREKVNLASWTKACLNSWAWSHDVLAGLHSLSHARCVDCLALFNDAFPLITCISDSQTEGIPLEEVYSSLHKSLLSHSRPLRLNTLRFLDSNLINAAPGQKEVVKRCLQGEEVSLDVQGVRERVLRIGRVGQVLREGDETGADLCARWLTGESTPSFIRHITKLFAFFFFPSLIL